jgi:hypothetical protein
MAGNRSEADDNSQPTVAGCLLLALSLVVIGAVALPLVSWRDPDSGRPLPRSVAIVGPVLAGAVFYGIGTGLLRILGLSVLAKPKQQSADSPSDPATSERDRQTQGEPDPGADQPRD